MRNTVAAFGSCDVGMPSALPYCCFTTGVSQVLDKQEGLVQGLVELVMRLSKSLSGKTPGKPEVLLMSRATF
jgi:hypothetical protein